MKALKSFGEFWYDFIIGDDWRAGAIVVTLLALTAILAHAAHVNAWWLLPAGVLTALAYSLARATRRLFNVVDTKCTAEPLSVHDHEGTTRWLHAA